MIDINAYALLGAATNLARLHQISQSFDQAQPVSIDDAATIKNYVGEFRKEAEKLGARLSVLAADRLLKRMSGLLLDVKVADLSQALSDIDSRFADHVTEIPLCALDPQEAILLQSADYLVEQEGFAAMFPSAAFEVEEAAKCIAYGRYTASVFHSMRMLEVGIKALARRLGISDPAKPAEKNWGAILKAIRTKIDERWPSSTRMAGSEGSKFDDLYAHLDAVRGPWRNATMHVENIYVTHEALHILRCSAFFMRRLSALTNEAGNDVDFSSKSLPE